jgi:hypothetical protein
VVELNGPKGEEPKRHYLDRCRQSRLDSPR